MNPALAHLGFGPADRVVIFHAQYGRILLPEEQIHFPDPLALDRISRRIRLYCDGGNWQRMALRAALLGEADVDYPVTSCKAIQITPSSPTKTPPSLRCRSELRSVTRSTLSGAPLSFDGTQSKGATDCQGTPACFDSVRQTTADSAQHAGAH